MQRNKRNPPQTDPRYNEEFVPPIMIESPAFIKGDRFDNFDQELKQLIKQQRQIQKNYVSPFDNVSSDDDDDLVVPTCAKEALKQRKMEKKPFGLPSFLIQGDSDSEDDLVIPTVAKEYLKQKKQEQDSKNSTPVSSPQKTQNKEQINENQENKHVKEIKPDDSFGSDFEDNIIEFPKEEKSINSYAVNSDSEPPTPKQKEQKKENDSDFEYGDYSYSDKSNEDHFVYNKSSPTALLDPKGNQSYRFSSEELMPEPVIETPKPKKDRKNHMSDDMVILSTDDDSYEEEYDSFDSDDFNSTISSTISYKPKKTPTRKKSVFASADDFTYSDKAFTPFRRQNQSDSPLEVPVSSYNVNNTKSSKYRVIDDDDEEEIDFTDNKNMKNQQNTKPSTNIPPPLPINQVRTSIKPYEPGSILTEPFHPLYKDTDFVLNRNHDKYRPFNILSSSTSSNSSTRSRSRDSQTYVKIDPETFGDNPHKPKPHNIVPPLDLPNILNDCIDQYDDTQSDRTYSPVPMIEDAHITESATAARLMLEVKIQDARLNLEIITKKWEDKINEEMKEGDLRLQQLDAKHHLEMRQAPKNVIFDNGVKIVRPVLRPELIEKMSRERRIQIEENNRIIEMMTQRMNMELEKPKQKLEQLEQQYANLSGKKPLEPTPPSEVHRTRQRRNTSRIMRGPPAL